jgi:hypothetical protein
VGRNRKEDEGGKKGAGRRTHYVSIYFVFFSGGVCLPLTQHQHYIPLAGVGSLYYYIFFFFRVGFLDREALRRAGWVG